MTSKEIWLFYTLLRTEKKVINNNFLTSKVKVNIYLKQLIECHDGFINRLIHLVGFTLIGIGIIDKSLILLFAGGIIQELGHFYQYIKTKNFKYSPLFCLKPQLIFGYPLFILAILYVVLAK